MSRIHPTAVLAVVVVGIVIMWMAMRHSARRSVVTARNVALPTTTTHGMELEGEDLHLKDWNTWMRDASKAVEVSMKEIGTEPVALATNVFRRLFPDRPWPPPPGSEFSDKWEMIVRAIAVAVKRPLPANLEVIQ